MPRFCPISFLKTESGWEVLTSAVMLQGLTPLGKPGGPFPYQHGNVEVGYLSRMWGSTICQCLKVVYTCLSFDTMDSGTAEGRCQPQDTSLFDLDCIISSHNFYCCGFEVLTQSLMSVEPLV